MDERTKMMLQESLGRILVSTFLVLLVLGFLIYFMGVIIKDPSPGSIEVRSIPAGIPIQIDGSTTQYITNSVIPQIAAGKVQVSLLQDRWEINPPVHTVIVKPNDTILVEFTAIAKPLDTTNVPKKVVAPPPVAVTPDTRIVTPDTRQSRPVENRPTRKIEVTFESVNKKPKGSIQVTTNIPGCEIILDSVNTGKYTPSVLDNIATGTYRISVTKSGYLSIPEVQVVTIDPELGMNSTHFELVSKQEQTHKGVVKVVTLPAGQTVTINGNRLSPTPLSLELPQGKYHIEFDESAGYYSPKSQQFTIGNNDTIQISSVYTKITGGAYLAIVQPRGSELLDVSKLRIELDSKPYFNGWNHETTAILWNDFPEGEHHFTLIYDNLSDEIDLTTKSGIVTVVELRFERVFAKVKPRIRLLEPEQYDGFRKRIGKILIINE